MLEHLRRDRTLPPSLWGALAATPAGHRLGRNNLYVPKPASPSLEAALRQRSSHVLGAAAPAAGGA